jgi:hypothetical protein
MSPELQREIDKYLSKKNIYFSKFSLELQAHLELTYPSLPSIKARWFMLKHNLLSIPTCEYPKCIAPVKWNERKNHFDDGCCTDHIKRITSLKHFGTEHPNQSKKQQQKVKKSIHEKYGVDYITQTQKHKDSVKETVREKYGFDSVLQSPEIRDKIKNTMLERHGVEYAQQSDKLRSKTIETNIKHFGVEESLSSSTVRKKINKTNMEKFGSIFPMRNEELLEKRKQHIIEKYDAYSPISDPEVANKLRKTHYTKYYNEKLIKNTLFKPLFTLDEYIGTLDENNRGNKYMWKCMVCDSEFSDSLAAGNIPTCPTCYPKVYNKSLMENDLFEHIDVNKEQGKRGLIGQKEIDIYLPDFKLGIEFNGIYWHSEQKGKNRNYHLDKSLQAENVGISLIHVFETEWLLKKNIVLDIINRRIGNLNKVDLDTTEIDIVTTEDKSNFLTRNNIFGDDIFITETKGIYKNNELLAIMTAIPYNNGIWIRHFVIKRGIDFKNGNSFGLLFRSLNLKNDTPVLYSVDRRYNMISDPQIIGAGFTFEGSTDPSMYFSSNNKSLILSSNIDIGNISSYVTNYDPVLSIKENMVANGYLTIWDCGKLVYKFY